MFEIRINYPGAPNQGQAYEIEKAFERALSQLGVSSRVAVARRNRGDRTIVVHQRREVAGNWLVATGDEPEAEKIIAPKLKMVAHICDLGDMNIRFVREQGHRHERTVRFSHLPGYHGGSVHHRLRGLYSR